MSRPFRSQLSCLANAIGGTHWRGPTFGLLIRTNLRISCRCLLMAETPTQRISNMVERFRPLLALRWWSPRSVLISLFLVGWRTPLTSPCWRRLFRHAVALSGISHARVSRKSCYICRAKDAPPCSSSGDGDRWRCDGHSRKRNSHWRYSRRSNCSWLYGRCCDCRARTRDADRPTKFLLPFVYLIAEHVSGVPRAVVAWMPSPPGVMCRWSRLRAYTGRCWNLRLLTQVFCC